MFKGKGGVEIMEETIIYIYNSLYSDYKKLLRKRIKDSIWEYQAEIFYKHLKNFQNIIKNNLKFECEFIELKNYKDFIK